MIGILGRGHRARALFYDNLADTLDAGLPLRQALSTVASGASAPGRAAHALEERVLAGASLADAMAADPRTFSAFERHATHAGATAGRLPEILRALSGHFVVRGQALESL